ncbi:MAG: CoB--CoM heterodisulfide reductase iron-sulfur subunit A family protein [Candidatus Desulforudis sp.]|nr:CoB--CoM heterodisulfide reductase iron-sulfur subunit A family protein [Desulforudis sp.]
MPRTGVFVCWCGSNIGGVIDCPETAAAASGFPGVAFSTDYKYMCSEPGQNMVIQAIREHRLDRAVVASCSPRLHEETFRKTLVRAGLNPYMLEMANIREHCTWVHGADIQQARIKAVDLVRRAVAKANRLEPLFESEISVTRRCLVIGGGVAGIQAALDVADAGHEVILVEREPTIGGNMVKLDKTFPTLDCSACISTPKMVAAATHPNIKLYTYAEIEKLAGYVGNFEVTIRQKARYVDHEKCTGCGTCWEKCPTRVPSEFDAGIGQRTAIYIPFPQAVPNKPVIDREHCRYFATGKCEICAKLCPTGAVDYGQEDLVLTEKVGAVVAATGFGLFDWSRVYGEYGYGQYPDVVTGMQFERLVNAAGPTGGKLLRPSDGATPRTVVFIKCVGSRDEAKGRRYCSRICCMYTAKHALQVLEKVPGASVFVFYMDVRTAGKGYEEFYQRAVNNGTVYVRGRVSKIYQDGERLVVRGVDTLLGRPVEVDADMVVLATAVEPGSGAAETARILGINTDQDGFFQEAHPKLRPVETHTRGVFLAGACQAPKDIPDTVAQASGAAAKVAGLLSSKWLSTNPMIATVNEALCTGCFLCVPVCSYRALEPKKITERLPGHPPREREVAGVNTGLCQGCGACNVACRAGAIEVRGFTNEQLLAEVDALCQ